MGKEDIVYGVFIYITENISLFNCLFRKGVGHFMPQDEDEIHTMQYSKIFFVSSLT